MNPVPPEVTREREKQAWELRQRFWTEQRIADHLGIERSTVSKMLDRVERDLAAKLAEDALPIKARQTALLEQVAAEAFAAWEKSKTDAELERTQTKEVEFPSEARWPGDEEKSSFKLPAVEVKTTKERKGQAGDPALLDKAMKALADIRAIWGLDAPQKKEHSGPGGGPIEITDARDELDARLAARAARRREAGADPGLTGGDSEASSL